MIFYSPSCGHCHQVITEDLPPLLEKYGEQLQIVAVNTADPGGQALFLAAIEPFGVPAEQRGVPMLVVGDVFLVGSVDIPQRFPGVIEQYLARGGVDWPAIPGLAEALAVAQPQPTAGPAQPTPADTETVAMKLARDPLGNGLSIAVLVGMVTAVVAVVVTWAVSLARLVALQEAYDQPGQKQRQRQQDQR